VDAVIVAGGAVEVGEAEGVDEPAETATVISEFYEELVHRNPWGDVKFHEQELSQTCRCCRASRSTDVTFADQNHAGYGCASNRTAVRIRATLRNGGNDLLHRRAMVATISCTDGPLPLAKRRLSDAVAALVDPQPATINGAYLFTDPLYTALRGSLRGSKSGRTGALRSAPCKVEILSWLIVVDQTVSGWEPGKTTLNRLHQHAARSFRPQDCALIDAHSGQLERWAVEGERLLADAPRVYLVGVPCPRCGAASSYHRSGGECIRRPALRVSEDGCSCEGCGAFWGPDRFHWLARLLGCPALPT
jgi:hypothetical protein